MTLILHATVVQPKTPILAPSMFLHPIALSFTFSPVHLTLSFPCFLTCLLPNSLLSHLLTLSFRYFSPAHSHSLAFLSPHFRNPPLFYLILLNQRSCLIELVRPFKAPYLLRVVLVYSLTHFKPASIRQYSRYTVLTHSKSITHHISLGT